ncbi:hypothetical protein FAI40_02935 [Acetobacteraceae bacterium]|nr:hypothetical protein FAI40_02935 [Acetobacteraceae bacterium]
MAKKEIEEEAVVEEEIDEGDGIARITAFSPRFEKMLIACIFVMALAIVVAVVGLGSFVIHKMYAKKHSAPAQTMVLPVADKAPERLPATDSAKITNDTPVVLNYPKLPGEGLRYALSLPDGGIGVVVTRAVPPVAGKTVGGTEERILVWYPDKGRVLRELRMSPPSTVASLQQPPAQGVVQPTPQPQ